METPNTEVNQGNSGDWPPETTNIHKRALTINFNLGLLSSFQFIPSSKSNGKDLPLPETSLPDFKTFRTSSFAMFALMTGYGNGLPYGSSRYEHLDDLAVVLYLE